MARTEARRLRPGDQITVHGRTLTIRAIDRQWPWSRDITLRGRLDTGSHTLYRVNARKELEAR
ncbi:hypothetical protein ABZ249_30215 [Nocardiopsis sp. NPDC006139]|uniref:hypothetical protein n=1 Tax=Nocardiopsis sp. NPDC006139 TaxID=3154578 RepID=UPI0033BA1359